MKKLLITLSVVLFIGTLFSLPATARAEDAPNTNVTRRRPDRPANFSPSPSPQTLEIKQVQSSPKPWYTRAWERLVSIFQ